MPAKKKTVTRSASSARDYSSIARNYARSVVAEEIPACKWVKAACQRHLNDLEREEWEFHYDPKKANAVCRFIELLPHVKGKWTSPMIHLSAWRRAPVAVFTTSHTARV